MQQSCDTYFYEIARKLGVDRLKVTALKFGLGEKVLNKTFSNDIVVDGNFTVSGTTTTINTATLLLEDNIITLNAGTSGAPSENAGLTVDRGSSADVNFQFNESLDKWQFTNDGSTYVNIAVDTDTLTEGSTNLYFTNARADARAARRFATKLALADTGDLVEGRISGADMEGN